MNILITGGAGFIGSHLADYLLKAGHNITIFDDLSSGKIENISKECKLIVGDINDANILEKTFDKIDFCYHLAAIPSVQKSIDNWLACHKVNLTGTINVFLEAAKRKIPVIYASSAAVYGNSTQMPLSEENIGKFISPYGVDKYTSELQASVFAHCYGLKSIGFRFFNVYGQRQDPNSPYSGVISIFINKLQNNKPLNIYGDGTQERDFIFIDDVVKCLALAKDYISVEPQIYNLGIGYGTPLNYLIKTLFQAVGHEVKLNYLSAREGDIYKSISNPEKVEKNLGFKASIKLSEGIASLIKPLIKNS
ncbi:MULTISPECIES: NAD-dependent epimerase/dehydratase family protein [unclassified Rickettsia]|uniref:NAD-dependent epimerase/dehydratase family protein n=1 Tax=unclassified Rickettsia TaxID=114295 RepID=UPI00313311BB